MCKTLYRSSAALVLALALGVPTPASAQSGDLGEETTHAASNDGLKETRIGIGFTEVLSTRIFSLGAGVLTPPPFATSLGLRLWLDRMMLEPLLGLGLVSGTDGRSANFYLNAGMLVGYALKTGNLRPIVGGGLTFGVVTGDPTHAGFTIGPMFGLEYRFTEFPALSFDAALFLPLQMQFDPFIFSFQTAGTALIGMHYYF